MIKKKNNIDFWFSIGSTYTYLTVNRIKEIISKYSININFKPFNVRTIMLEMDNRPFISSKKMKVDYMWRDIQRRAENYKITVPSLPVPYPIKNMELVNQVALLGVKEGWCLKFLELTYYNWFINKLPAGDDENFITTFKKLKLNYEEIKKKALKNEIKNSLIQQTKIAKSKGIFGAPSFIVGEEIFWGDDRFEDAIEWQKNNVQS